MPILMLPDLPRGAPSWVGQNIKQTVIMDIVFVVSNLWQQTGGILVALEDRVLDFEKQKGLNFTKLIPIYDF